MKKIITLLLTVVITSVTYGQTLNIKGGISISKLNWEVGPFDFSTNTKPLIGYSFFAGIDFLNRNYFFISSDFGLIRKGTNGVAEFVSQNGQFTDEISEKIKLDYLTLNTTINVKYPVENKLFPYVSIGPRIDYLVNYSDGNENKNDHILEINYGLILGGGIKYSLSKIQVGISTKYNVNFNQIAKWPAEDRNIGGSIKDNTFIVLINVGYKLKKDN